MCVGAYLDGKVGVEWNAAAYIATDLLVLLDQALDHDITKRSARGR